jgi:lysophospholipase L1-like esterase
MKKNLHCHSMKSLCGLVAFLTLWTTARAQEIPDSIFSVLTIGRNVVNNASHLQSFYEKLYALRAGSEVKVNIIHIGDSHIQADFLTEVVRKNLQREFGNAGRGLIVPAKIAGTNEPLNFKTSSAFSWNSKRVVHPAKPLPIGIGAITVNTLEPGATFAVKMNDAAIDYSFNTVTLFYDEGLHSFNFSLQDSLSQELALIAPVKEKEPVNYATVNLGSLYRQISFKTMKKEDAQRSATVFGLSLENGNPGVLYHSIGVNGAKYEHYNAASLFAKQTKILNPDLIIISLGTNESVEYPYVNKNFSAQISRLVSSLAFENPAAAFILITPPDAFLRKTRANPGIETVRMEIVRHAVENGLAFWDMYKVNGGKSSAAEWRLRGLLRPDGIHFSREGYAHQGNLLYEAIMKGYNDYVSNRHP